ncbi:MAG: glycoside hydrolase family 26 protein [Streptosporangiaceae bacterium]
MTRRDKNTLAMPFAAAAVFAVLLVATGHATFASLNPSAKTSAPPQASGRCEPHDLRLPFAGIATNPEIPTHVQAFQHATGAHIQVVEFYNPFTSPFRQWEAKQATDLGALPLIQLNPRNVSLRRIAAGGYDQLIRQYADAVKAFRCRIAISFGHEMNGWWYRWGMPWTKPTTFIAAWRHIHDLFRRDGVSNVIWSWDPSHMYLDKPGKVATPASEWYPGNAYVDWVGIDGYVRPGQTFQMLFDSQLHFIRSVTSKPIYIAETGVANGPEQKAQIAQLFAGVRSNRLTGLIWFDLNGMEPWRLEGRPAALGAYRKAVASFP